ncbi:MAG TPA: hypothetical protein VLT89_00165 [Usitatibacter sp.]|nr:hypothetical protein [Usitatibacter sp.]
MTWRLQKLFALAAIAAALLINSLPAKSEGKPRVCLGELIEIVLSRGAA